MGDAIMNKILIPLDGSKLSEEILDHIEYLAKRSNAEIILLRVVPFFWPDEFLHVRKMGDKLDNEACQYLYAMNAKLERRGIAGEVYVDEGHIPGVICDFVKEKEIDLIAMSTHGMGGLRKWYLGSVTDKVIQGSSVPVLVYRNTGKEVPNSHYKNILIPIDGSAFSENIFSQARYLVELLNTKVWFIYVIDLNLMKGFTTLSILNQEERLIDTVQNYFPNLENRLKEAQVEYEIVVKKGCPAEEICAFAEKNNIDLIAMCTHGRSGIGRWAMGSVASKVLQISSKPVLLTRARN
jgi:nucleotide-binding universal stress UspA family protein